MSKKRALNIENILGYPDESFIPYACYVDNETILTKDENLLMTLKIPSFISNKSQNELYNIRNILREIFKEVLKNNKNISYYFNTLRKKADIRPLHENINNYFLKETEDIWNTENNWDNQFVNEIYISIILPLEIDDNILKPLFFAKSLTQIGINSIYTKEIDKKTKILKKVAYSIKEKLLSYDLKILSIVEREKGVFYSEHLRFFSSLVNLEKEFFPITFDNLSERLIYKKIAYGKDTIELDKDGEKKYTSVFTIKSFNDLRASELDKILQLPMELTITETISHTDDKYALYLTEEERKTFSISKDEDIPYLSGLNNFTANNKEEKREFCISQISIMIINENKVDLIDDIKKFYKEVNKLGVIVVRENTFLPTIFWSQLPANFKYLKRFQIIPADKMVGYTSLFTFPIGRMRANHWGNAITIIPTILNTPYFFNFHTGSNGNTLILGEKESGKTTLTNFLVSKAYKTNQKIFYIDTMRSSEVFINALGGKYYRIAPNTTEEESFKINLFDLDDTPENRKIFESIITDLVDFQDDGFVEMGEKLTSLRAQYSHIPKIVEEILKINKEERNLQKILEFFNTKETSLIFSKLKYWRDDKDISFVFNNKMTTELNDKVIGISLKTIINNKDILTPVLRYLFVLINKMANGDPFILVIDNTWKILDNKHIAPYFLNVLKNSTAKNMITIAQTDGKSDIEESVINESINNLFGTKIYLSNQNLDSFQKRIFDIQEEEAKLLSLIELEDRKFLLKKGEEVVLSYLNLEDFEYYKNIFVNNNISINAMKKAKQLSKSNDANKWIPLFLRILEEYEEMVKMKKIQENEINERKWEESRNQENNQNKIIKQN